MPNKWYSVRTLYRSRTEDRPVKPDLSYDPDATLLEERVVLIRAKSRQEAQAKALREAKDYAGTGTFVNPYEQTVRTDLLRTCDVYELHENPADKTEVYVASHLMSRRIPDAKVEKIFTPRRVLDHKRGRYRKFIKQEYLPLTNQNFV